MGCDGGVLLPVEVVVVVVDPLPSGVEVGVLVEEEPGVEVGVTQRRKSLNIPLVSTRHSRGVGVLVGPCEGVLVGVGVSLVCVVGVGVGVDPLDGVLVGVGVLFVWGVVVGVGVSTIHF